MNAQKAAPTLLSMAHINDLALRLPKPNTSLGLASTINGNKGQQPHKQLKVSVT